MPLRRPNPRLPADGTSQAPGQTSPKGEGLLPKLLRGNWHRRTQPRDPMSAAVSSTDVTNVECATYEVGGQRLAGFRGVSRRALPAYAGFQPPLPEPDGHVSVHPALRYRVLRMKAESPIRATSTLVEPSTCPPSSCPGHYPRHWATTGTLSPWALLPVGDPVVVCQVWSTFRAPVRPLPRLIVGCALPEDHEVRSSHPVRQESGYQRLSRRCRYTPTGTGVQAIQPCPCVA